MVWRWGRGLWSGLLPSNLDELEWAAEYAGLWGYFAHERLSDKLLMGAVSPAGPKFNKDGSVRVAWESPLVWAELAEGVR